MIFQCKVRPCAVPIVKIETTDTGGNLLPKPINRTKVVKFGHKVGWVDRCSRKHFIPLDDEAKALNKKDYALMREELMALGVKHIYANDPFWFLADSLAAIKARHAGKAASIGRPLLEPEDDEEEEVVEPTNAELKAECKAKGIKYHPNDNKAKLKERLAGADKDE